MLQLMSYMLTRSEPLNPLSEPWTPCRPYSMGAESEGLGEGGLPNKTCGFVDGANGLGEGWVWLAGWMKQKAGLRGCEVGEG